MKEKSRLFKLIIICLMLLTLASCGAVEEMKDPESTTSEIPAVIDTIIGDTTELATSFALQLDGEWADYYLTCLGSGQGREFDGYEDLKATLEQFRIESGAVSIYLLTDIDSTDSHFEITVDGSAEPSPWMTQFEIESPLLAAAAGIPGAELFAHNKSVGTPVWTAFSPVYDSDGMVVGVLAIEHFVPILSDYPEWNRDSPEWNDMEGAQ